MQSRLIIILTLLLRTCITISSAGAFDHIEVAVFAVVAELYRLSSGCPKSNEARVPWVYKHNDDRCHMTQAGLELVYGAAEIWCRKSGGHLAMPKTHTTIQNVANMANSRLFYVGLDSLEADGWWYWADGTILRKWQKKTWADLSQQQQKANSGYCVQYDKDLGQFQRVNCHMKREFVCEAGDYDDKEQYLYQETRCHNSFGGIYFDCGGFCYWYDSTCFYNFYDSWHRCKNSGGTLAMPKTRRQWRALYLISTAITNGSVEYGGWLGIYYKQTRGRRWFWSDTTTPKEWFKVKGSGENAVIHTTPGHAYRAVVVPTYEKHIMICQTRQDLPPSPCGEMLKNKNIYVRKKRDSTMANQEKLSKFLATGNVGSKPKLFNARNARMAGPDMKTMTIEQFPWFAKVYVIRGHKLGVTISYCSAVLIGPRWVLTAAHCLNPLTKSARNLKELRDTLQIEVGYGSEDRELEHEQNRNIVVNVWIPAGYSKAIYQRQKYNQDIAILELSRALPLNCPNVRPICYSPLERFSEKCFLFGFDKDSRLRYCAIRDSWNSDPIKPKTGWITHPWGADYDCFITQGDSGGPVACYREHEGRHEMDLLGIQTHGDRQQDGSWHNYFTRIQPYYDWISRITAEKYALYNSPGDWVTGKEAEYNCEDKGGVLAMPKTWRQLKDMEDVFRKQQFQSPKDKSKTFWIGIKGKRLQKYPGKWSYTFLDGDSLYNEALYQIWQPGQPKDIKYKQNNDDCVAMDFVVAEYEHWEKFNRSGIKNLPCSTKLPYMCEFPPYKEALVEIPKDKAPSPDETLYIQRGCRRGIVDFSCTYGPGPYKTVVKVQEAKFGRWSDTICRSPPHKLGCYANVTDIISKHCNGHNRCRFQVSAMGFFINDTCRGYNKYLEMTYKCEEKKYYYQAVCEKTGREKAFVYCPPGREIIIRNTTWGRDNPLTCSKLFHKSECNSMTIRKWPVMKLCTIGFDRHLSGVYPHNCSFTPSQMQWSEDPCPGENKYYEISWSCHEVVIHEQTSGDGKIQPQVLLMTVALGVNRLIPYI